MPADSTAPALSIEEATRRIGADTLEVLRQRFNGKLTTTRRPDNQDQLF